MATGTLGSTARYHAKHALIPISRRLTFADATAVAKTIGIIPGGSLIIPLISGIYVTTAWDSATSAVLDIGTSANDDLYATDLDIKTANIFKALDELGSATDVGGHYVAADTTFICTPTYVGTPTAGAGIVVIWFLPNIG